MSTIIIGGDVCPSGNIQSAFTKGKGEIILNDLFPIFNNANYSVVNLECPLIIEDSPIEKDGPALGANINCINGLRAMGVNAVNLSNNHILDHGEKGLESTFNACEKHGIEYFGAGKNLKSAKKPLIKTINNKQIGFIGIAEREFSIASNTTWGANPVDVIEIVRTLNEYRNKIDHLIILVHGGKEHYHYPTPKLQKLCRFLVEEGADAVICQHSHCAGTYEYYQNKPIVYGQGNFIFENLKRKSQLWNQGFLVSLDFNDATSAKFIPFEQSKGFIGAKRMNVNDETKFLEELEIRSKKISSSQFVEDEWKKLCKSEKYLYSSRVLGHNRFLRILNRNIHFSDWLYSKKTKMMVRNVVECEVHREGLETLWHDKDVNF
jgi:hypothetical protein